MYFQKFVLKYKVFILVLIFKHLRIFGKVEIGALPQTHTSVNMQL